MNSSSISNKQTKEITFTAIVRVCETYSKDKFIEEFCRDRVPAEHDTLWDRFVEKHSRGDEIELKDIDGEDMDYEFWAHSRFPEQVQDLVDDIEEEMDDEIKEAKEEEERKAAEDREVLGDLLALEAN